MNKIQGSSSIVIWVQYDVLYCLEIRAAMRRVVNLLEGDDRSDAYR
jgi:hypothetical protein